MSSYNEHVLNIRLCNYNTPEDVANACYSHFIRWAVEEHQKQNDSAGNIMTTKVFHWAKFAAMHSMWKAEGGFTFVVAEWLFAFRPLP